MLSSLRTRNDPRWYYLALGALILAAWAVLAGWAGSPYAGWLDHGKLGESGPSPPLALVVFIVGWTLMTIAMMLPSTLPLLNLFRRIVSQRSDGSHLIRLVLAGYLTIWAYAGAVAYLGDRVLHAAVDGIPALSAAAPGIGAGILMLAGVYQFTPLKTLCLDKCRSPLSFIAEHWRGGQASWQAFRLGMHHGLFCVGCCWTLMLLMFAIGGLNLGWMLILGAVMGAERATRWGRQITRPLGAGLIVIGLAHLSGMLSLLPAYA